MILWTTTLRSCLFHPLGSPQLLARRCSSSLLLLVLRSVPCCSSSHGSRRQNSCCSAQERRVRLQFSPHISHISLKLTSLSWQCICSEAPISAPAPSAVSVSSSSSSRCSASDGGDGSSSSSSSSTHYKQPHDPCAPFHVAVSLWRTCNSPADLWQTYTPRRSRTRRPGL